ncbi:MAG: cytochrome c556 [Colwellia sp.]
MTVEQLFSEIIELSTQVDNLLKNENEVDCESLLAQRQSLLENLAEQVKPLIKQDPSSNLSNQYYSFLKDIQQRDILSIKFALKQSKVIHAALTKQAKSNKAITAYKKIL